MIQKINEYLYQVQHLLERVSDQEIAAFIGVLLEAHQRRRQIFIMGNGGSAATASHFACDLAKGTIVANSPRFRVVALTDNVPLITAWGNDTAYENIFAEQLAGLVQKGDVVIGISGSGNSENVLKAMRLARMRSAVTVGISGYDGGKLKPLVDVSLHVPSFYMEQVEDVHVVLVHLVCTTIREILQERRAFQRVVNGNGAGVLQNLTDHLTHSLPVTVGSMMLLDGPREHVVVNAVSTVRDLPDAPLVGREIPLDETPGLRSVLLDGRALLFRQHEPGSSLSAQELRLASSDTLRSGALLPIRPNGKVIGAVMLGEMRSWDRSPLTEARAAEGTEIVEEWRSTLREYDFQHSNLPAQPEMVP